MWRSAALAPSAMCSANWRMPGSAGFLTWKPCWPAAHNGAKLPPSGLIRPGRSDSGERWRRAGRRDILGVIDREHAVWMGDHLVSAEDGHYLRGCPFLVWEGDHSRCAIYDTRPRVCRDYQPGSSEICPQFASNRNS